MNAQLGLILNFGELRSILLFSNTPTYLYTRFHRDSSVRYLAHQYETEVLLADLEEALSRPVKNIDELVGIYALCVSLSFKPFSELSRLKDFASNDVEWFEMIKKLVFEDSPKAQHIAINVSQPFSVSVQQNSAYQCTPSIEPASVLKK